MSAYIHMLPIIAYINDHRKTWNEKKKTKKKQNITNLGYSVAQKDNVLGYMVIKVLI